MIVVSLLPKWWHIAIVNARKKNGIMAQSAITVRIDSGMKSQFDKLCEEFGMSANTAFNIFVNAVVRTRGIPFSIKAARAEAPSALDLFMQQRRVAEASQEPEMTLEEINAEIRASRNERLRKGEETFGMRRKRQQAQ